MTQRLPIQAEPRRFTEAEVEEFNLEHAQLLKPRQRNSPPWGRSMSAAQYAAVHPAFVDALKAATGYVSARNDFEQYDHQCGGCRFYMPLEGAAGADWGACGNPVSDRIGRVVFEHHGCLHHSSGPPIRYGSPK